MRNVRWRQAALLLASTSLALAVGEIWLRATAPTPGHWSVHDATLGWVQKPGYRGRFRASEFDTALHINAQGLRESETFPEQKSRVRIALVGDSFAWGHGVEEHERFGERLDAALGPHREVLNFAIAGHATDQHLLRIERDVLPYDPDVVLLAFYFNDLIEVQEDRNGFGLAKPRFEIRDGALHLTGVPLPYRDFDAWTKPESGLRLWRLAGAMLERPPPPPSEHRWSEFPMELLSSGRWKNHTLEKGITLHERLLERIVASTRSSGARVVLLEVPFKEHFIPGDELERRFGLARAEVPFDLTQQWLERTCERLGIRYLNPYAWLTTHGGHELFYAEDRHLTARGHAVLAEWLATNLAADLP